MQGAGAGHSTHPDTRGCCRSCSAGPAPGTPPGGGSPAGGAAPPHHRRRCRAPTGTTRPTAPLLQDRGSNVGARGDPDRPGGGDMTSTALLAVPAPMVAPAPPPHGERALGRTQLDHPHRTALHHAARHCTAQRYVALCGTALQRVEPRCTAQPCTTLCHTAPRGTDWQLMARHGTARHCTALHGTARHCTAPYHTAQHRTAPHCMARHGTAQQGSTLCHPPSYRHPLPVPPCTPYASLCTPCTPCTPRTPRTPCPPGRAGVLTWAALGGGAGPLALAVPGAAPAPVLWRGVAALPGGGLGAGAAAGGAAGPGPPRAPAPVHAALGVGTAPQRPCLTRAGGRGGGQGSGLVVGAPHVPPPCTGTGMVPWGSPSGLGVGTGALTSSGRVSARSRQAAAPARGLPRPSPRRSPPRGSLRGGGGCRHVSHPGAGPLKPLAPVPPCPAPPVPCLCPWHIPVPVPLPPH